MEIRKACLEDPREIASLINIHAAEGLMLPRALNDIYENLRDFFVCVEEGHLAGCAALHICWDGLGEVRSLAVRKDSRKKGIGRRLLQACIEEARQLGMKRVFALTYEPDFFRRYGFRDFPKEDLPHKIWSDCLRCPHFPNCNEKAMILDMNDREEVHQA